MHDGGGWAGNGRTLGDGLYRIRIKASSLFSLAFHPSTDDHLMEQADDPTGTLMAPPHRSRLAYLISLVWFRTGESRDVDRDRDRGLPTGSARCVGWTRWL